MEGSAAGSRTDGRGMDLFDHLGILDVADGWMSVTHATTVGYLNPLTDESERATASTSPALYP